MKPETIEQPPDGRRVEPLVGRMRELLLRLRGWDMMDVADDGKYWRQEIDSVIDEVNNGDPLSIFTWLDAARFVPDKHGGHIEFAGKTFHVAVH